jgi:hypothetical protein
MSPAPVCHERPHAGFLFVRVELVHREDEVLAAEAGLFLSRVITMASVGQTWTHSSQKMQACRFEREVLGVTALLAGERRFALRRGLDRDDLRRADPLAELAADALLVAVSSCRSAKLAR